MGIVSTGQVSQAVRELRELTGRDSAGHSELIAAYRAAYERGWRASQRYTGSEATWPHPRRHVVTPDKVCGLPVVAMIKIPDAAGHLPDRHAVVCQVDDEGRDGPYVVWTVTYAAGQWAVTGSGRYELPWQRALVIMLDRALDLA